MVAGETEPFLAPADVRVTQGIRAVLLAGHLRLRWERRPSLKAQACHLEPRPAIAALVEAWQSARWRAAKRSLSCRSQFYTFPPP